MAKKKQSNYKHPADHPDVKRYQQMVRDSINEIESEYADRKLPKQKQKQIDKLEINIKEAPYWLQNILPVSYRKYRIDKEGNFQTKNSKKKK